MELREFVSNTLIQIIQGVKDVQNDTAADGALVNPRVAEVRGRADPQAGLIAVNGEPIRDVQFDVVVTVTIDDRPEGNIAVFSASLMETSTPPDANLSGNTVSRIKFRVPLSLPIQD